MDPSNPLLWVLTIVADVRKLTIHTEFSQSALRRSGDAGAGGIPKPLQQTPTHQPLVPLQQARPTGLTVSALTLLS